MLRRKNRININLAMIFAFCVLLSYGQERQYSKYWLKSKEERNIVDAREYAAYGIISLDSVSIEKIRKELKSRGQILSTSDTIDVIYQPSNYMIIPLISDSLNTIGIYRIKFNASHSSMYLIYKDQDILEFADSYDRNDLIIRTMDFISSHEDLFSEKSKIVVWKKLADFMLKYYYKEQYSYFDVIN